MQKIHSRFRTTYRAEVKVVGDKFNRDEMMDAARIKSDIQP